MINAIEANEKSVEAILKMMFKAKSRVTNELITIVDEIINRVAGEGKQSTKVYIGSRKPSALMYPDEMFEKIGCKLDKYALHDLRITLSKYGFETQVCAMDIYGSSSDGFGVILKIDWSKANA